MIVVTAESVLANRFYRETQRRSDNTRELIRR